MHSTRRWDPCISHRGQEVRDFISGYFNDSNRKSLLIAGAGFDPRSCVISNFFGPFQEHIHAILIQENRPTSNAILAGKAKENTESLQGIFKSSALMPVSIFDGSAVVGGRNVLNSLKNQNFDEISDVIVDVSALSVGVSFPIIRFLLEHTARKPGSLEVHIFVTQDPELDASIQMRSGDTPDFVHGFRGDTGLNSAADAAKLWLPQLASGRGPALRKIHDFVSPDDTCPILPFPASNPRIGDELAEEFLTELESTWSVDTRNIVYADEDDPLDLYRTILRLDDLRKPVFEHVGGSRLILSPDGSKIMALGALMAALERNLPVAYLEAIGYDLDPTAPGPTTAPNLVHVWLEGGVYPHPQTAQKT